MTGFKSKWTDDGFQGISYDAERHDAGVKKIFGKRGRFTWKDVLDLVLAHRAHPPYLVNKLWSYFVTEPPSRGTTRDLVAIYKRSGMKIKPVVAAILRHPALYRNLGAPDMVKSPIVYVAGSLRTAGLPLTMDSPTWMLDSMGQRPFDPPSVAGWEWGPAWMSSNSMRVRFDWGNQLLREELLGAKKGQVQPAPTPADALEQALNAVGRPWISSATRSHLLDMAAHFYDDISPRNLPRQVRPARRCSSRPCASSRSPAPTPSSINDDGLRPPRLRRLPPDDRRPARALARALADAPPDHHPRAGRRPRRLRGPGDAVLAVARGRRPPRRRPRPTRPCSSRCSFPAASICSTRYRRSSNYGRYADLRQAVKVDSPPALGSTGLGVHPSLAQGMNGGVKGLFDAGKVGFLPGIDYANPDLSHFHSRHFWETGLITSDVAPGWLGRWLDRHGVARQPAPGAVARLRRSRRCMRTARAPVAAVSSPDDAELWIRGSGARPTSARWTPTGASLAARPKGAGPGVGLHARRGWPSGRRPARALPPKTTTSTRSRRPCLPQGERLRRAPRAARRDDLAAARASGSPRSRPTASSTRTTTSPRTWPGARRRSVSQALAAFQADLEARGVADRVLTLVWSEFGRRPEANESNGTDHGAGGIAWVQGTRARGGILTDYPSSPTSTARTTSRSRSTSARSTPR